MGENPWLRGGAVLVRRELGFGVLVEYQLREERSTRSEEIWVGPLTGELWADWEGIVMSVLTG